MRISPLLFLPLITSCGIDVDRDDQPVDVPATSEQEQALNGDVWSTVYDDNLTTTGTGAAYQGIAISPTTHTTVVVGGHSGTWFAFRKTVLTSWSSTLPNTDPFDLGHGGIANAVAVSTTGTFFSAGSSIDAANKRHVIIRRSTDDGTTWTTVLDSSTHGDANALAITVDSVGNAYASGYTVDGTTPSTHGVVWKVPTSGAPTEANVVDGIGSEFVALNGICTDGGTTIYTTGNKVLPAPPGFPLPNITIARLSIGGATWATAFEHQFRTTSAGTGCGVGVGGHIWFSGYAIDSSASSYQVIDYNPATQTWIEAGWFSSSQLNRAQAILHLNTRMYVVGTTWNDSNGNWRVRYKNDSPAGSTWTDSDTVHKTGAINIAVANAAAYQPAVGSLPAIFYVVGTVPDSTGHFHGIVRQRTAF